MIGKNIRKLKKRPKGQWAKEEIKLLICYVYPLVTRKERNLDIGLLRGEKERQETWNK